MSEHSPGPWHVEEDNTRESDEWGYEFVMAEDGETCIADVHVACNNELPREVAQANATLIAAAPGLLEAAKEIVAALGGGIFNNVLPRTMEAIAKAEGRTR